MEQVTAEHFLLLASFIEKAMEFIAFSFLFIFAFLYFKDRNKPVRKNKNKK